jgi:hypothetical protein
MWSAEVALFIQILEPSLHRVLVDSANNSANWQTCSRKPTFHRIWSRFVIDMLSSPHPIWLFLLAWTNCWLITDEGWNSIQDSCWYNAHQSTLYKSWWKQVRETFLANSSTGIFVILDFWLSSAKNDNIFWNKKKHCSGNLNECFYFQFGCIWNCAMLWTSLQVDLPEVRRHSSSWGGMC